MALERRVYDELAPFLDYEKQLGKSKSQLKDLNIGECTLLFSLHRHPQLFPDQEIALKNYEKEPHNQAHKDDLDQIQMKYESLKDTLLTDVFTSSLPKEFMINQVSQRSSRLQKHWHEFMNCSSSCWRRWIWKETTSKRCGSIMRVPSQRSSPWSVRFHDKKWFVMIACYSERRPPSSVRSGSRDASFHSTREDCHYSYEDLRVPSRTRHAGEGHFPYQRKHEQSQKNLRGPGCWRVRGVLQQIEVTTFFFQTDMTNYHNDPHSVASVLKAYLRELPDPLTQDSMKESWVEALKLVSTRR